LRKKDRKKIEGRARLKLGPTGKRGLSHATGQAKGEWYQHKVLSLRKPNRGAEVWSAWAGKREKSRKKKGKANTKKKKKMPLEV